MIPDRIVGVSEAAVPPHDGHRARPDRPLPRPKGRKRILQSLQRISSSPSLARLGRGASSGYRGGGTGSISCVSLSSAPTTGHPYGADASSTPSSGVRSAAPASCVSVAGPDAPVADASAGRSCIRLVETDQVPGSTPAPTTCPVPARLRSNSRGVPPGATVEAVVVEGVERSSDATLRPRSATTGAPTRPRLDRWTPLPDEIKTEVFRHLEPRELVRCSAVCRAWHRLCFDGQLWRTLDASTFYRDISADSLAKIVASAGPFVRDLNLRGCLQLQSAVKAERLVEPCRNLERVSLEGCLVGRGSLHRLVRQNARLVHLDLTGLSAVCNGTGAALGQHCPSLRFLNVSWCSNMDARGLRRVVDGCPELEDLRVSEIRGFDDDDDGEGLMLRLFETNALRRLIANGCSSLTDDALRVLLEGVEPEVCPLLNRAVVPARRLRHLDLGRCHAVTDAALRRLAHNVPHLEGLQLGGCAAVTDASLLELLPTVPRLTHLDLEELGNVTNATMQRLAESPCRAGLEHVSVSYCERVGDTGMLPVLRACRRLRSVDVDNTRVSDLVLAEAAATVRERSRRAPRGGPLPRVGLRLVVYDCQNVTWTGVREVLSRNAEARRPPSLPVPSSSFPTEVIQLKCFYGWQMTVDEHLKRVLGGEPAAATRLERKWAEYMMSNEEAGAPGAGGRRRRRRAREAAMLHADEEEGGAGTGGIGRRRRARSGGCLVM